MNTPLHTADPPESTDWRDAAACLQVDCGDVFFPERGGDVRPAKTICAGCPVAAACLRFAMDNNIDDGIFGGLSGRERVQIRRSAYRAARDRAAA